MNTRLGISIFAAALIAACTGTAQSPSREISSYEECVQAGNPVRKSMPPSCVTPDGTVFESKQDQLIVAEMCKSLCGDGQCQEIVCMGSGCPCPETKDSCPKDCQ